MSRFFNRFFRAVKLEISLFQEILEDARTQNQSLIVVFLYSMAAAYGTFGRTGTTGINIGMITTLLGWYVWAFSTYMIGARFLPEPQTEPDRKSVMRAMGFATAPGVLRAFGFLQGFGLVILVLAIAWMVAAATIGVKLALRYDSTSRAAGVVILGGIISALFQVMMFIMLFSAFGVSNN
jgi:hypothetical protein